MDADRIKEIQEQTAYPESVSVQQALLKVWNEAVQEQLRIGAVSGSCGSEMLERLINSHFSLFRRLNQINNKEPQSEATQKALEEAREVNRFFSDKDSPRIVQS